MVATTHTWPISLPHRYQQRTTVWLRDIARTENGLDLRAFTHFGNCERLLGQYSTLLPVIISALCHNVSVQREMLASKHVGVHVRLRSLRVTSLDGISDSEIYPLHKDRLTRYLRLSVWFSLESSITDSVSKSVVDKLVSLTLSLSQSLRLHSMCWHIVATMALIGARTRRS